MTNEEILTKVIEKAQKNGWYSNTTFKIIHWDGSIGTSMFLHGTYEEDGRTETWHRDVETLIFNHYFAKAFWGEAEWEYASNGEKCGYKADENGNLKRGWEYFLQKMVLEKNPIRYLEKFL